LKFIKRKIKLNNAPCIYLSIYNVIIYGKLLLIICILLFNLYFYNQ